MSLLTSNDLLTQHVCAVCDEPTNAEPSSYDGENKHVCEDCDFYFEWCNVCQTSNYSEYNTPCRHLFWNEIEGEWEGFGNHSWEDGKKPFMAMLQMAGIEFAVDLRRSLLAHKYYFQFCGSIFGVENIDSELLQEDGRMRGNWKGPLSKVFEIEDEKAKQLAAMGVSWLSTLWSGWDGDNWENPETVEADLVAAGWCEEFIAGEAAA